MSTVSISTSEFKGGGSVRKEVEGKEGGGATEMWDNSDGVIDRRAKPGRVTGTFWGTAFNV